MKEKLLEFRNKLTSGPWDADALEIQFIRNYLPPSYCKVQPTKDDIEFIIFVRNNLDEIIEKLS